MSFVRGPVATGLLVVTSLALCACESTSGHRTKPGFLPVPLESLDGLDGTQAVAGTGAPPRFVSSGRVAGEPRTVSSRSRAVPTVRGLTFRGEPLDEAFRTLSTVSEVPILVTPAARQVIDDEGLTLDLDLTVALPLNRVLDLMTGMSPELDHE